MSILCKLDIYARLAIDTDFENTYNSDDSSYSGTNINFENYYSFIILTSLK